MALRAIQRSVLAVEFEASLCMVKVLRVPLHESEVRAVVFAVTFHARRRAGLRAHQRRMISAFLLQAGCDVPVAIQAPKVRRRRRDRVALRAGGRTAQILMRLRKRSRRDLRFGRERQEQQQGQ